jgi:murein DD-endopeptidase MepM/ murein hydrolase activator NlpD
MIGIQNDINTAITLLKTPLDLGFGQLDIDETGQPAAPPDVEPSLPRTGLPDPKSAEMYRIAAALVTEGSGPQSTVDMMQVVVNRKASGRYGATYTDILSAGTGGKNVAFEGVWKRPGGPKAFRQIQTLEDAAKWSGQSKATLLRIISDIQNPTLQANSAKFVGGAFDFRASPQNNPNGRLPGTAWRGGAGDNQFLTDPNRGDPIRKEGPAPFNLPAAVPPSPAVTGRSSVVDTVNIAAGGTKTVNLTEKGGLYGAPREGGRSHAGIDINTGGQTGWYVGFKASGTVIFAGVLGDYGNVVIIKSGNTDYYFAHLARIMVQKGKAYNGEVIGEIGTTGRSTGIHLHYEVRPNGRPIDPKPYLNLLDIGRKTVASQTAAATSATPSAQIASAKPETSQTTTQITTERKGQVIVLLMPETQVAQAPMPTRSKGRGSALTSSSSDTSELYTYIEQSQYFHLA